MRHNKYDDYKREARKLSELINESPWRKKVYFEKPIWNGTYKVKWVLKHETHPKAEIARSLIYLIPNPVFSGRYLDYRKYQINLISQCDWTISEEEYSKLDNSQKKFFTNIPFGFSRLYDRYGRKRYKMRYWEFNFFYSPVVVKNKITHEWIHEELPEIRKYSDKLYRTGFGKRYFFVDHKPRISERIYNEKGKHRREFRELQYIINEGLSEYYN